jgi:TrmH family RNA methyltransferase
VSFLLDAAEQAFRQYGSCMQNRTLLDRVSIVLADTKTPANIGAVARCMMNMGLSRLILVNPPSDKNGDASRLAAGADRILEQAQVCTSLAEAVVGQGLVIGTSRHIGRQRKNVLSPRDMALGVVPLLARNNAAILFGNEVNGLELRDIALCQELVSIPSAEAFPSLNLSHAVMIVAYELFVAAGSPAASSARELAPAEEVELFYDQLQETLQTIGFFGDQDSSRMMHSLRQIFGRSRLDSRDVQILRGILTTFNRSRKSNM